MFKFSFIALSIVFLFPFLGEARVRPATDLTSLEKEAGEVGNEDDISVMSNTVGPELLRIGAEPYIPYPAKAGLGNDEASIFDFSESPNGANTTPAGKENESSQ